MFYTLKSTTLIPPDGRLIFSVPFDMQWITVVITDAAGNILRRIPIERPQNLKQGTVRIVWDGRFVGWQNNQKGQWFQADPATANYYYYVIGEKKIPINSQSFGAIMDIVTKKPIKRQQVIHFQLEHDAKFVQYDVYDSKGHLVRRVIMGPTPAGIHRWTWDGRNNLGEMVGPGTYYFTLRTDYMDAEPALKPVGGRYDCVVNLILKGWDLNYAAKSCEYELPEDIAADTNRQTCIETLIRRGYSYNDAVSSCSMKLAPVQPTPTPVQPTPTPVQPTPTIFEPYKDEGIPPALEEKQIPNWVWGLIAGSAFLLLTNY